MPAFQIRDRLIPYRILAYLLYAKPGDMDWLEGLSEKQVRVTTGDAARYLRMKNAHLWQALYWLRDNQLIAKVEKEEKRGTAVITLKQPTNIHKEVKNG